MLAATDTSTLAGLQEVARICSSSGLPAGAFLTAGAVSSGWAPSAGRVGGHVTMDDGTFLVAVWNRYGDPCLHRHVPRAVQTQCRCHR